MELLRRLNLIRNRRRNWLIAIFLTVGFRSLHAQVPFNTVTYEALPTKNSAVHQIAVLGTDLYFVNNNRFQKLNTLDDSVVDIPLPDGFVLNHVFMVAPIAVAGSKIVIAKVSTSSAGIEPVIYDPSTKTFSVLKDIHPTFSSAPDVFQPFGDHVYFLANDGSSYDVWRTNGTSEGTVKVFDTDLPHTNTNFKFISHEQGLYFSINGTALYFVENNAPEAVLVKEFTGTLPVSPNHLTLDGRFIVPVRYNDKFEVWSIGTSGADASILFEKPFPENTFLARIGMGDNQALIYVLSNQNGELSLWTYDQINDEHNNFFNIAGSTSVRQVYQRGTDMLIATRGDQKGIWKTDGTTVGTVQLTTELGPTIIGFPFYKLSEELSLYIAETQQDGWEHAVTDGTAEGTFLLRDINPGPATSVEPNSNLRLVQPALVSGKLYLMADDGVHGFELWKTDGTSDGTTLVADMSPDDAELQIIETEVVQDQLFSRTRIASQDYLLSLANNSLEFNNMFGGDNNYYSLGNSQNNLVSYNTALFAEAYDNSEGQGAIPHALQSISGTQITNITSADPSKKLTVITDFKIVNNRMFFKGANNNGFELWTSDGTLGGTYQVAEVAAGSGNAFFSDARDLEITYFNGKYYFTASDQVIGHQVWETDLTEAGTTLFFQTSPGGYGPYPNSYFQAGGELFFFTEPVFNENKVLWVTNGDAASTTQVMDFGDYTILGVYRAGTNIFFLAKKFGIAYLLHFDQEEKTTSELTSSNYSIGKVQALELNGKILFQKFDDAAGTFDFQIIDENLTVSEVLANKQQVVASVVSGEHLFMILMDGELWRSDGTEEGTELLATLPIDYAPSSLPYATQFLEQIILGAKKDGDYRVFSIPILYALSEITVAEQVISSGVQLDFETTNVLSESAGKSVSIKNNGYITLTFSNSLAASIEGTHKDDFVIKNAASSNSIGPGKAGSFDIHFTPTGAGLRTATLKIQTNDKTVPVFEIALKGEGLKLGQQITFNALPAKTFGDAAFELSGTSTSGLAVSYSSSDQGIAKVEGSIVTFLKAGTATIIASQAGNEQYNAATPVEQQLTIARANQTISFAEIGNKIYGDGQFELSATSSAGLPVTFSSSNTAVSVVNGASVIILKAGVSTIIAQQPGNDNYLPATAARDLTVSKASQTISFGEFPAAKVGDSPISLGAVSTSGLPIVYESSDESVAVVNGSLLEIKGAGSTDITAIQEGDENYLPAGDVVRVLVVDVVAAIESGLSSTFVVYPVPASDALTIANQGSRESDYVLLTLTGKTITTGRLKGATTTVESLQTVSDGVYLLIITTEKEQTTYKIVKGGN